MVDIINMISQVQKIDIFTILDKPINTPSNYIYFDKMSFTQAHTYYHFRIFIARNQLKASSIYKDYQDILNKLLAQADNNFFEVSTSRAVKPTASLSTIYEIELKISNHWRYKKEEQENGN